MASSSWQKAIAKTTPEFIYVKWGIKLSRLLLTLACGQIVGYLV